MSTCYKMTPNLIRKQLLNSSRLLKQFLLTLDVKWYESLVDQCGVRVVDPAAQKLPIVHGSGYKGEGAGKHSGVALLQVFSVELRVRQVVCVHPLDLRCHLGAVIGSVACQLQILITNNLLWYINVGLIWKTKENWPSPISNDSVFLFIS